MTDQDNGDGYYNVKLPTDHQEEDDYYNSVQGLSANTSQPLLNPEDNEYVYMKNSAVPQPIATGATAAGKPSVAAKPRHLSEPLNQPKKYINIGPSERQLLQEKVHVQGTVPSPSKNGADVSMTNGVTNGGTADIAGQPLYENFREEDEDEGGKEIYQNIVR